MSYIYRLLPYNGPCTSNHYNKFYNPSLCHVCKRSSQVLIPCQKCEKIVYCNNVHQSLHEMEHRKICKSIVKYKMMTVKDLLLIYKKCDSLLYDIAFTSRICGKFITDFVKGDMDRELQLYEEQMLMFPKMCLICQRGANLYHCGRCYSVFSCESHFVEFTVKHEQTYCNNLLLSLNSDILNEVSLEFTLNINLSNFPNQKTPFYDMDSFFMRYVLSTRRASTMNDWTLLDHFNSDYVSAPLTVHVGMHRAQLLYLLSKKLFIIHVIGANDVDKYSLPAWEILLHLSRRTKNILIVMIGPELAFQYGTFCLCKLCETHEQVLNYEYHPMLYHNYVNSPMYVQPDIIIGFQAYLYENGTAWDESILALQAQKCPLFLTNINIDSTHNDICKIKEVLGTTVIPTFQIENRYRACRPYRNLENKLHYRNSWLICYKHLYDSSNSKK